MGESKNCEYCFELTKNCICEWYNCSSCNKKLSSHGETYEYRGAYSCPECFDKVQEQRNSERQEIIDEQKHKTDRFKDLDLSDSSIGKANKQILKTDIEIASKETEREKRYRS